MIAKLWHRIQRGLGLRDSLNRRPADGGWANRPTPCNPALLALIDQRIAEHLAAEHARQAAGVFNAVQAATNDALRGLPQ